MSEITPASRPETPAIIYGGDHSPWVQAVLLGLHLKGIDYRVQTFPPWRVFKASGILMPAARCGDGRWMLQSQDILEAYGYDRLAPDDLRRILRNLRGGVHRVDSTYRFWRLWSWVRDEDPSLLIRLRNMLMRPFLVLYFNVALARLGVNEKTSHTPAEIVKSYAHWQGVLEAQGSEFLDGSSPGIRDVYVFAGVQLHASMPVPPLTVSKTASELARLRKWIGAMTEACGDYRHLYSGPHFEVGVNRPVRASKVERATFWLGAALQFALAPIVVPLVLVKLIKVRREKLIIRSLRV